jgi:hypothetical protein
MAWQSLRDQGLLNVEASRSHSTGLLWTSDQSDAETCTWQHTTLTKERHPCPRRDSNPQSQQASGRRPMLRPRGRWHLPATCMSQKYIKWIPLYLLKCVFTVYSTSGIHYRRHDATVHDSQNSRPRLVTFSCKYLLFFFSSWSFTQTVILWEVNVGKDIVKRRWNLAHILTLYFQNKSAHISHLFYDWYIIPRPLWWT